MSRMDQSTYEKPLPNGFTADAKGAEHAEPSTGVGDRLASGGLGSGAGYDQHVRVSLLDGDDIPAVTAMLGRCSRATLYKRFHGFTDGVAHASQALAGPDQGAFGAWTGGTCIGMANLAVDEEGYADIGVLVEDRWQRRGAGSALIAALVERAKALRLAGLIADVLADNYFLLPLLARVGAITTTFAYSGYRVRVGFRAPLAAAAIRGDCPVWGSE
jgi:GNAT superfamily N-acetyltransferase